MFDDVCCTCARQLSTIEPQYDEKTEKPTAQDRRLDCCGRIICGSCIKSNKRFEAYCILTCYHRSLGTKADFRQVHSVRSPLALLGCHKGSTIHRHTHLLRHLNHKASHTHQPLQTLQPTPFSTLSRPLKRKKTRTIRLRMYYTSSTLRRIQYRHLR